MIFSSPHTLVYPEFNVSAADVISQMGLSAEPMKGNPSLQYYLSAFMTMANIPHGNALPSGYILKLKHPELVQDTWWDAGGPWVQVVSAEANTCTNARVIVASGEAYILRKSTGRWEKLVENDGKLNFGLDNYQISNYNYVEGATKKIAGRVNLPSFNNYSGGTYYVMHNAFHSKVALPGGGADLAGLFVTCKVRLVGENGETTFGDSCRKYASLGFDFWPTVDSGLGLGKDLEFSTDAAYNPGSGSSAFTRIPIDGSWLRLFYIPCLGSGAVIDTTSAYAAANGVAAMCMSASQIAANPPVLLPNTSF